MLDSELIRWMKNPPSKSDDWEAEKKKETTNEYLSLLVVDLAVKNKKSETLEQQHITSENIDLAELEEPEDLVENKEYIGSEILEEHEISFSEDKDETVLSSQTNSLLSEEDVPRDNSLLTPEEEASTWKDYKGSLFDEINNKETTFVKPDDLEAKVPQYQIEDKSEASTESSEDETFIYSYRNRKNGVTLAEEYRKGQRRSSEQTGMMRKKRLIMLGLCLFLIIALIAASIPFIKSEISKKMIDETLNKSVIKPDIDKNAYKQAVEIMSSDSNSIRPDVESRHEKPSDNIITDPEGSGMISDENISSDLGQDVVALVSDKSPLITEDKEQIEEQSKASSEIVNVIAANTDRPGITKTKKNVSQRKVNVSEARKTTSETKTRKKPANDGIRAAVSRTTASVTTRANSNSPISLTGKELPKGADAAQEKVYSAIRSRNYVEAVNLSKSNLENNSLDKFSFFSLGLALYSTSDFSGATEAFYTCLKFNDPQLPNFMVEEFDSGEHLKNTYFNYPGIDLIIRAVELNPKSKSLYVNLFLSNLKSEKPRLASEIYQAVLNHAKKHG